MRRRDDGVEIWWALDRQDASRDEFIRAKKLLVKALRISGSKEALSAGKLKSRGRAKAKCDLPKMRVSVVDPPVSIGWAVTKGLAGQSGIAIEDAATVDAACVPYAPGRDRLLALPLQLVKRASDALGLDDEQASAINIIEAALQWHLAHETNIVLHAIDDRGLCDIAALPAPHLNVSSLGLAAILIDELKRVSDGNKSVLAALRDGSIRFAASTGMTFVVKKIATGVAILFWKTTAVIAAGVVGAVVGGLLGIWIARKVTRIGYEAEKRELVARMKSANLSIARFTEQRHEQVLRLLSDVRQDLEDRLRRSTTRLQNRLSRNETEQCQLMAEYLDTCLRCIPVRREALRRCRTRLLEKVRRSKACLVLPTMKYEYVMRIEQNIADALRQLKRIEECARSIDRDNPRQFLALPGLLASMDIASNLFVRATSSFSDEIGRKLVLHEKMTKRAEVSRAQIVERAQARFDRQLGTVQKSFRRKCKTQLDRVAEQHGILVRKARESGISIDLRGMEELKASVSSAGRARARKPRAAKAR